MTITGPSGAQIRYTQDGSTPSAESTLYSQKFVAASETVIKAIAILDGVSSEVTSYVVPDDSEPEPSDH